MRTDTLQVLKEYNIKTIGSKKNIERVEELVHKDERILYISPTSLVINYVNTRKKEKLPGIIVLTNNRVLFSYQIMFNTSTEIISLDEIRSINSKTNGLSGGHIELHTITKTYDILVSYKRDIVQKIVQTFEAAEKTFRNAASSNTLMQGENLLEKIEKLHELNQKGILTDEEFKKKKEELLSKL